MHSHQHTFTRPELTDRYKCVFHKWSTLTQRVRDQGCSFIDSREFTLASKQWKIRIYPFGLYEDDDSLGISLCNMSNSDIRAKYSISIINQIQKPDKVWKDPEGVVLFKGYEKLLTNDSVQDNINSSMCSESDNEWGCDNIIKLKDLNNIQNGFLMSDQIIIQIELEYFGVVDIDSQPWARQVVRADNEYELINIANKDLLRTAIKRAGNLGKEDALIDLRDKKNFNAGEILDTRELHIYTSRLGTAAIKFSQTLDSSPFIMSITNPSKYRRGNFKHSHSMCP